MVKSYHYTESGLDNIYLLNGFQIKKLNGEEEIFIHDIHGLHEAIGRTLISKNAPLNGKEVRFIRGILDLSQSSLAKLLGCTYQTILAWEKGKWEFNRTADRLLRIIFLAYLEKEKGGIIYDQVNEIADIDAEEIENQNNSKFHFKEISHQWRIA